MTSISKQALLGLSVTALIFGVVSCSKAPESSFSSASVSASASASIAPLPKPPAPQLPHRDSGLWETTVSEQGSSDAPRTFKLCLDKRAESMLSPMGDELSAERCFKHAVTQNPDASWAVVSECNMGSGGVKSYSGKIEGDHATNFKMTLRVQTAGASVTQMNRVANYTVLSKRLSACEKDQKAGDMLEYGVKINLFDLSGKAR